MNRCSKIITTQFSGNFLAIECPVFLRRLFQQTTDKIPVIDAVRPYSIQILSATIPTLLQRRHRHDYRAIDFLRLKTTEQPASKRIQINVPAYI